MGKGMVNHLKKAKARRAQLGVSDVDQFAGLAQFLQFLQSQVGYGNLVNNLIQQTGVVPASVMREFGLGTDRGYTLNALQTEADIAANPRDWIKLAFMRAGQDVPSALQQFTNEGGLAGSGEIPWQFAYGDTGAPQLFRVAGQNAVYAKVVDDKGNVQYRHVPNPYVFNQVFGGPAWKQIQEVRKGTGIASLGQIGDPLTLEEGLKYLPAPTTARGRAASEPTITTVGEGGKAEVAMLMPGSVVAPLSKKLRAQADKGHISMRDAIAALLNQVQKKKKKAGRSEGGKTLPSEFLDIPFIQHLMSLGGAPYVGTDAPIEGYGTTVPVSPYGGDVAFAIAKLAPSEAENLAGLVSAYGVPPEDYITEVQRTISSLGVAPRGARATFAPVLS